jgi:hypothetical protein
MNQSNIIITSLSRILYIIIKNFTRKELKEMFRKTKELQSLVNASRNNLEIAERKVENRNILIADLQKKNEELSNENIAVHEENKDLRFENEEQRELIDRIKRIATSNAYNNEKAILGKIKELISDAENQN